MGEHKAARVALAEAERIFARMPPEGHDHLAFRFSERRLQFYRIGTLIELGEGGRTGHRAPRAPTPSTRCSSCSTRPRTWSATARSRTSCNLAEKALLQVPPEHRTSIVLRAQALLSEVPPVKRKAAAVRRLTDLLGDAAPVS